MQTGRLNCRGTVERMFAMARASRRALRVLSLFQGDQPSWLLDHADFQTSSRLRLWNASWTLERILAATDIDYQYP